eukprot:10538-Eustigmatos_ZCMA.PRE.1
MELDDQALLDAERVVHGANTPRAKHLKRSTSMQYNSSALKYQVSAGQTSHRSSRRKEGLQYALLLPCSSVRTMSWYTS